MVERECACSCRKCPFVLTWLDARALSGDWAAELPLALNYLTNHGGERDRILPMNAVGFRLGVYATPVGRGLSTIRWASSVSLSGCWSMELAIGNLHFRVVDYGDARPLSMRECGNFRKRYVTMRDTNALSYRCQRDRNG